MGQILHGSARTTAATRRQIQHSQESIATLAKRLGVNPKTVAKWRQRKQEGVADRHFAPKKTRTVLSETDQAIALAFRKSTQLPLDDCLDALQKDIPNLTRSNLHRMLKKNGLSCLPKEENQTKERKKFKEYPIGYVHVDITEIHIGKEKLYVFVGICRVCKFVFAEVFSRQTADNACIFLENLVKACPFKIHTILTDNGSQFTYTRNILKRGKGPSRRHGFGLKCGEKGIRHRTTEPYRPQTNGQVERFNRTLKEATTKVYHYETVEIFVNHLRSFVLAYNVGKKLSCLKRKTPYDTVREWWKKEPKRFNINPDHHVVGLNN
jgi:transposase InsO family protein